MRDGIIRKEGLQDKLRDTGTGRINIEMKGGARISFGGVGEVDFF